MRKTNNFLGKLLKSSMLMPSLSNFKMEQLGKFSWLAFALPGEKSVTEYSVHYIPNIDFFIGWKRRERLKRRKVSDLCTIFLGCTKLANSCARNWSTNELTLLSTTSKQQVPIIQRRLAARSWLVECKSVRELTLQCSVIDSTNSL